MQDQVVCRCGIVLENSAACPVCGQAVATSVSLEPMRFDTAAVPAPDLNQAFGYRPRLLEEQPGSVPESHVYRVFDAPNTLNNEEEDRRRVADILRKSCRQARLSRPQLETHWWECLRLTLSLWPIILLLGFGCSLVIPFGIALFSTPEMSGWNTAHGIWLAIAVALVAYTLDLWHRLGESAIRGKADAALVPGIDLVLLGRSFFRGLACFLAGPALLVFVAGWYWAHTGDLGAIDEFILTELLLAAGCYWLFALLATIKANRLRGAAPLSVMRFVRPLGYSAALAAGLFLMLILFHVPWLMNSISFLHINGFSGWFSLLLCSTSMIFCITFLFRWQAIRYHRQAADTAVPVKRMATSHGA